MEIILNKHNIQILPEKGSFTKKDIRDEVFIEKVLGLKEDGDSINLVRKNCFNNFELAHLITEKKRKTLNSTESLFGFCAWLSNRDEITTLSNNHDCEFIVKLIIEFCIANKIDYSDMEDNWTNILKCPQGE